MNCKKCGLPLEENSKFCGFCGAKVETEIENSEQPIEEITPNNIEQPIFEPKIQNEFESTPVVEPVAQPEMPTPVIEPVQQPEMPTLEQVQESMVEPKRKKNFVLPIILILLLIGVLAGVYYYLGRPDKMVKSIINTAYDKLDKQVDEMYLDYETIFVSGDLSIDTNIEELEDIKGLKLNYQYGIDNKNEKMEMGTTIQENETKLLDVMGYIIDNNLFISLKEDYPSIIKVDGEELGIKGLMNIQDEKLTKEETKYLLKAYKDIILESLDMNDFEKTNAKITLDGETTKVSKLTFKPTAQNMSKLTNNITEKTLEDDKLLEILSKSTKEDKEMLKRFLEQSKNTQATRDSGETMTLDFYTKGITNEFVGMDIQLNSNATIEIRKNKTTTTVEIITNQEPVYIRITEEGNDSLTVITTNINGEELIGKISVKTNEIDNKTEQTTTTIDFKYQEESLVITSNSKTQIDAEIATIDVTNAKDYTEITEEEMNKITETYTKRFENSSIYKFINTLTENLNNKMYEEDYNYDYNEFDNYEEINDNIEDNMDI